MKICVVSTSVFPCPPPGYSGLEMIAYHTAAGLTRLGYEVSLVAPEGSSCPGGEVIVSGPVGGWGEKQAYDKYWERLPGFDVIIDHTWQKWSYILKMEGKLKAPVLGVMHAPVNTMYQELPPIDHPCMVCISEDQAAHFRALFNKDCRVCYNGIDLDFYQSSNVPRTDRFLFLARFSSIKGADIAIKACLEAGVGLDLIGDTSITNEPEYYHQCMELAKQSSSNWNKDKGKQIRVIGPATRGETIYWFSQSFCLLHPNQRFREPFGLAPIEAMVCGCPVIAWNNGAMRETIPNQFLVKSYDELVQKIKWTLVQESQDWEDIRRSVLHESKKFSVENMARRYESLSIEAIEGGW